MRRAELPLPEIEARIKDLPPPRGFAEAIRKQAAARKPALIAEVKKASPSAGILQDPYDPAMITRLYADAGAACLSVLTDAPYFMGKDSDLQMAREACALPVLRKDFMLDPYQIYESRLLGADCILLILAALEETMAQEMAGIAHTLSMDVLVEVHGEAEAEKAARLPDFTLVGVNNRGLQNLKTDLSMSVRCAPFLPRDRLLVSESGIKTREDIRPMRQAGFHAFLVGESLLTQKDVSKAVQALLDG